MQTGGGFEGSWDGRQKIGTVEEKRVSEEEKEDVHHGIVGQGVTIYTYQLIDQGMEKGDIRFKSSQAIREVLSMGNIFNRHHELYYVISRVRVKMKE